MANTEKRDPKSELHLLLAFRRRKNNPEGPVMCFREILRREDQLQLDLDRLKVRVRSVPGMWRIHKTVNPRDVQKAARTLQHRLLDNPQDAMALETVWKTCLLQKESRAARDLLIDIDDPAQLLPVIDALPSGTRYQPGVRTPSGGYHVVTELFDTREICKLPNVSVQRDGYVFLEEMVV